MKFENANVLITGGASGIGKIMGRMALPTKVFDWFFGQVIGLYHAMDNFTGRKKPDAGTSKAS